MGGTIEMEEREREIDKREEVSKTSLCIMNNEYACRVVTNRFCLGFVSSVCRGCNLSGIDYQTSALHHLDDSRKDGGLECHPFSPVTQIVVFPNKE